MPVTFHSLSADTIRLDSHSTPEGPAMRHRRTLLAASLLLAIALTGCSGSDSTDYTALVFERYGDCLEALDVPADMLGAVVTGNDDTLNGSVFVPIRDGVMLEWNVISGTTGDVLTVPDNTTATELATVGC